MNKVILTVLVLGIGFVGFAQDNANKPQRFKYITTGPDGTISLTIYDDTREDSMKLESVNSFYRYEILDLMTSEPVFSSRNKGKECTIDKTKIASGIYNLKLYTLNFVISSKIKIGTTRKMESLVQPTGDVVASR